MRRDNRHRLQLSAIQRQSRRYLGAWRHPRQHDRWSQSVDNSDQRRPVLPAIHDEAGLPPEDAPHLGRGSHDPPAHLYLRP